jgi:hypothetical protein
MAPIDDSDQIAEPSDSSSDEPSLLRSQRQLIQSPGYRAMALTDRVKRIGYIFQANVGQYKALVFRLQDPKFSLPLLGVQNRDGHADLLSEAERLLHNVLTSMMTRVDQQRVFMNKHFSDDLTLTTEYREKISHEFAGDPSATFLKDLRNHIAHHQLPVAQSRESWSKDSFSVSLILPCGPLLQWDWSSGIKDWITEHEDAVEIVAVIDSYARKAGSFDKWLFDMIAARNSDDIRDFYIAQEKHTREYDRVFGS